MSSSNLTPLEEIITMTQDLETVLEEDYGAVGRGLHEKASSVEHELSRDMLNRIRFIATIRNKAVHDDLTVAKTEIANVREAYKAVYVQFRHHNRKRVYRKSRSERSFLVNLLLDILQLFVRNTKK